MLQTIADIAIVSCMIRGLFERRTYEKCAIAGAATSFDIENEVAKTVVNLGTVYVVAPFVSTVEGARAFYRDGKSLVDKIS
jgi:hypothetical protein